MKKLIVIAAAAVLFIISGCSSDAKDKKGELADMKAKLEKLKKERSSLDADIRNLEEKIAKADPEFAKAQNIKLVEYTPVTVQEFVHYIELQGRVDADNISYVTPRGMPAQVKAIYIKKGDFVKKGQALLKLDDAVQLKQLDGLKTQLAYAEDIYNRTKNLWNQGIGTEVQLKAAENNVKSLKDQINTLTESWQMTNVSSEVNGYVEQLNLRVGETFTGFSGSQPQIMIINTSSLKVVTDVPENYIGKIGRGTPVIVSLPDVNLEFKTSISLMNQSVGINSRAVSTEAKIPYDPKIHVNQVAQVKIKNYSNPKAMVIPLTVLQTDESGKYVFVVSEENGKKLANKKKVTVGEIYGEEIEVLSGLQEGDKLITRGYQGLYEGQAVTTELK
jgi:membrane fusion protein (multidrug efflux system)